MSDQEVNGKPCPINSRTGLLVEGYESETPFVCTSCQENCRLRVIDVDAIDWQKKQVVTLVSEVGPWFTKRRFTPVLSR